MLYFNLIINSARFRIGAALGPFKYAAPTPTKKNVVNIYMIFFPFLTKFCRPDY